MNRFIEVTLALVVVGTTLAFGGVQTITFTIMEFVVFGLFLLLLLQQTRAGLIELPLPIWPILFVVLVASQLIPIPVAVLEKVSPARLADVAMLPGTTWGALSVYPRVTWLGLVKFLAFVLWGSHHRS